MLNSLSSNYLSLEKTGGLFDIDATLPVLIIQFFLLVFLLKGILFEPLQTILKTRNELIQVNLKKARLILESVNSIDIKTKKIFKVANQKNLTELQQLKSKLESLLDYTSVFNLNKMAGAAIFTPHQDTFPCYGSKEEFDLILKNKLESVNTALKQNYEKQSRELFKQKLANYYNLPKQNYKWGSNVNTKVKKYVDRRPNLVL